MANKPNRYRELERYSTYALCIDAAIFILYLIVAGVGIIWLKVISAILGLALSGYILWMLYMSRELFRPRSLWITTGAAAILVCLLFSLLLNFPSPNKYKLDNEPSAYSMTQQL